MSLCYERFILVLLAIISNTVRSQLNDTNLTLTTTIEPFTSTVFFTSVEDNIESNVTLICVQHLSQNEAYSEWSGEYEIEINNIMINNHQVWSLTLDHAEYNILYYDKDEAWIITEDYDGGDGYIIPRENIITMCSDTDDLINPTLCNNWMLLDVTVDLVMTSIAEDEECDVIYILSTVSEESGVDDASESSAAVSLGTAGIVGISVSVGVVLICLICFVVCKVRNKEKQPTDAGISLTPYVPAGMAYDSYKQNQTQQQAKAKQKKKKQKDKSLKKPAPTSVASASAADDGESSNVDSSHALINVFDEDDAQDDAHDAPNPVGTIDEDNNPFLSEGIFQTGTTLADEPTLGSDDLINVFDE